MSEDHRRIRRFSVFVAVVLLLMKRETKNKEENKKQKKQSLRSVKLKRKLD